MPGHQDFVEGVKRGAETAVHVNPVTGPAAAGFEAAEDIGGVFDVDVPSPDHPLEPTRERNERRVRQEVEERVPDVPDVPDEGQIRRFALVAGAFLLLLVGLSSTTFNVGGGD